MSPEADTVIADVRGTLPMLPYVPVARGPRLILRPRATPLGAPIAEVSLWRPDARELAVGLACAANAPADLVGALRPPHRRGHAAAAPPPRLDRDRPRPAL